MKRKRSNSLRIFLTVCPTTNYKPIQLLFTSFSNETMRTLTRWHKISERFTVAPIQTVTITRYQLFTTRSSIFRPTVTGYFAFKVSFNSQQYHWSAHFDSMLRLKCRKFHLQTYTLRHATDHRQVKRCHYSPIHYIHKDLRIVQASSFKLGSSLLIVIEKPWIVSFHPIVKVQHVQQPLQHYCRLYNTCFPKPVIRRFKAIGTIFTYLSRYDSSSCHN